MNLFEILLGRSLLEYLGAIIRYIYLKILRKKIKFSEVLNNAKGKRGSDFDETTNATKNYYIGLFALILVILVFVGYRKYILK